MTRGQAARAIAALAATRTTTTTLAPAPTTTTTTLPPGHHVPDAVSEVQLVQSFNGRPPNAPYKVTGVARFGDLLLIESAASDIAVGDTNGLSDIFVYEVSTNSRTRLQGPAGEPSGASAVSVMSTGFSPNVAFVTFADGLATGDSNGSADLVVGPLGGPFSAVQGLGGQTPTSLSFPLVYNLDGSKLLVTSDAGNLVTGDNNGSEDLFVYDFQTHNFTRVNVGTGGQQSAGNSRQFLPSEVATSGDGTRVAFISDAPDLVPNDTNGVADAFVHDLTTGRTVRASRKSTGEESPVRSESLAMDGGATVFVGLHPLGLPSSEQILKYDIRNDTVSSGFLSTESPRGGVLELAYFPFWHRSFGLYLPSSWSVRPGDLVWHATRRGFVSYWVPEPTGGCIGRRFVGSANDMICDDGRRWTVPADLNT